MSASIYGTIDEEQICPKIWLMTLISVPLPSNLEARLCRNTLTPRPDSPFLRFSFSKTVLTMVPILLFSNLSVVVGKQIHGSGLIVPFIPYVIKQ